ncbi:MAG: hypothetical protein LBN27_05990 [Prevotellaceae bacterium]|jgi:hypothetical protein|nr:hypothetical protein [Prevotellaceae bacterium]
MGYHVINIRGKAIQHKYVESIAELADVPFITSDSIIYQGEKQAIPTKIGDSEDYKDFASDYYRVSLKAQNTFKKQAFENGLMLEEINKDKENADTKRGDFLVRNLSDIEIDIKWRYFYTDIKKKSFDFLCEHAEKHKRMQEITKTPILIAVYERKEHSEEIIDNRLYFFSIDDLLKHKDEFKIINRHFGKCYHIPVEFTHNGFDFVKQIHKKYFGNINENKM